MFHLMAALKELQREVAAVRESIADLKQNQIQPLTIQFLGVQPQQEESSDSEESLSVQSAPATFSPVEM